MILNTIKPEYFRCERKFLITSIGHHEIQSIIRFHPYAFSQIYSPRTINNIYLDSPDMQAYRDNLIGISNRVKVRIRWYGETFGIIEKSVLELKIKQGLFGSKISFPLNRFTLDNHFSIAAQQNTFLESNIPNFLIEPLKSLGFVLLNNYQRSYYESADHKFRITLDTGLEFYHIDSNENYFIERCIKRQIAILELKYDHEYDEEARFITNRLPFRMTKSSKYVMGIESVYGY